MIMYSVWNFMLNTKLGIVQSNISLMGPTAILFKRFIVLYYILSPLSFLLTKAQIHTSILTFLVKKFFWVFARLSYVAWDFSKELYDVGQVIFISCIVCSTVRLKQIVSSGQLKSLRKKASDILSPLKSFAPQDYSEWITVYIFHCLNSNYPKVYTCHREHNVIIPYLNTNSHNTMLNCASVLTIQAVLHMSAGAPYPAPSRTSRHRYCRVCMSSVKWWSTQQALPRSAIFTFMSHTSWTGSGTWSMDLWSGHDATLRIPPPPPPPLPPPPTTLPLVLLLLPPPVL